MRVAINLGTRPFADLGPALRRLRLGMAALATLAIAFGIALHSLNNQAQAARASEHAVDASILKINTERQQYQAMMRQPDNAAVLDQVNSLNKLIDVKAFSWTLAMEDLETVLPGGVQVTTLEPTVDKKDSHITVRMRVLGPRDKAIQLVQNLEHSRRFLQPRIVGENAETAGTGNQQQAEPVSLSNRVSFDLLADYNPATATERRSGHKGMAKRSAETSASYQPGATPRTGRAGRRPAYGAPARKLTPLQTQPSAPGGPR